MIQEMAQGATILVDKPLGWTSFDVVNKLRWNLKQRLGVKNLKVGHAGTLDPLATGLLVICIGKHTKLIEGLTLHSKEYTGTILLGKTTPSYDLETAYNAEFETNHITKELLVETKNSFLGKIMQHPPLFSAKQINGKRAYEHARKGHDIVLKANEVEILNFEINSERFPEIDFKIGCSKGTYIRSIAHDFGRSLNAGGTLISLRRTKSGEMNISDSKSVDEWIALFNNAPL